MSAPILNAYDAANKIIRTAINDYRNPKTDNPNGDDSTCTIYLGGQCDVISEQGKATYNRGGKRMRITQQFLKLILM